jgi:hypothetical protein
MEIDTIFLEVYQLEGSTDKMKAVWPHANKEVSKMFHNTSLDLNHLDEKSLKASQLLDQIVAEPPNYNIKAAELKQGLGRAFVPGKFTQRNDEGFFDLRIKRGVHS